MTVDLPSTFNEGDADHDGQIGLYEWRQWKRGAMQEFASLDRNGDGFLTPAELVRGPAGDPLIPPTAVAAAPASVPPSIPATPTTAPQAATSAPAGSGSQTVAAVANATTTEPAKNKEDPEVTRRRAESMFRNLDGNQDGKIDSEEWKSSNKLRPQFEALGIDLQQPMSRDPFVQHYLTISSGNS